MQSAPESPISKFKERQIEGLICSFQCPSALQLENQLGSWRQSAKMSGGGTAFTSHRPGSTANPGQPGTKRNHSVDQTIGSTQGRGEVIRIEPLGPAKGFVLAVKCKQPICEMEDAFSAAG